MRCDVQMLVMGAEHEQLASSKGSEADHVGITSSPW
jgi:hypothetical protein